MKLGIGSVQFGTDYGISNKSGQTPLSVVRHILDRAATLGVRIIDTAPLYGAAEEVLGKCLARAHPFNIVTKTPSFADVKESARAGHLTSVFERSLARLGAERVHGLLVHHVEDLLNPGGGALYQAMAALKQSGKVARIGASIYEPEQAEQLLEKFAIDLIQVPVNVLDQRLVAGGHLARMKQAGVEIHVRSVFLQGALLMAPEELPAHFERVKPLLQRYRSWLAARDLDPLGAAIGFAAGLPHADAVIVGINNLRQLSEVVERASAPLDPGEFREFSVSDRAIINPMLWPAPCAHSA